MGDPRNESFPPHIKDPMTAAGIMQHTVLALLPAMAYGVYHFGAKALLLLLVSVVSCAATEYLYEHLKKIPVTAGDCSAVVTGILLAFCLPAGADWWMAALGGVFAVLAVRQLLGGLGQIHVNPALGGRCFLTALFAGKMTDFTYDAFSGATPLAQMKAGEETDVLRMVLGDTAGTIGETSVILILAGAAYLLWMGIIDLKISGMYLLSFSVFMALFGGHGFDGYYLVGQLAGGGLMLGVWFMANDYATRPITPGGQLVYGALLGVLTGIFRCYWISADGTAWAILIANLLTPLIERATVPAAFGRTKRIYAEKRKQK